MTIRDRAFHFTAAIVCLCIAGAALAGPEQEATAAAERWLAVVDAGDWPTSWDHASNLFRNAVEKEAWSRQLGAIRGPMGAVKSRTLLGAQYAESLPGAPDGRYVVIQYRTHFTNKASAVETVTPAYDDGTWRVSGYFIR
jgi:hypothetical protein